MSRLDPNDIKPSLCELVGSIFDGHCRTLTVGDLLDYLEDVPRETPLTYCDDGRSDTLTPIVSIEYQRVVMNDNMGGWVKAQTRRAKTAVITFGDR